MFSRFLFNNFPLAVCQNQIVSGGGLGKIVSTNRARYHISLIRFFDVRKGCNERTFHLLIDLHHRLVMIVLQFDPSIRRHDLYYTREAFSLTNYERFPCIDSIRVIEKRCCVSTFLCPALVCSLANLPRWPVLNVGEDVIGVIVVVHHVPFPIRPDVEVINRFFTDSPACHVLIYLRHIVIFADFLWIDVLVSGANIRFSETVVDTGFFKELLYCLDIGKVLRLHIDIKNVNRFLATKAVECVVFRVVDEAWRVFMMKAAECFHIVFVIVLQLQHF